MHDPQVDKLVGHLFRTESGKMASVLTRVLGFSNYDTAEDIVQETLLKAVNTWKFKGIPENPQAWLYTVAKRKAIDALRLRKIRESVHHEIAEAIQSEWTLVPTVKQFFLDHEIEDSQLRMIFACCHPAIPYEAQLALTLKTLCGLSVSEIAKAFLTNDETITKRIYRAREKIREENIALEVPVGRMLNERLEAVWHTLYLLFSEGYNSSQSDHFIRHDLCEEAMRLCLLLTRDAKTNLPQSKALLALMCLQASRENARTDKDGEIILLKDQDRTRWSRDLIEKGFEYLDLASADGSVSEYHLEAAISATHATAKNFDETNWSQILVLYESLEKSKPGAITSLNKAIATGYAKGREHGLELLLKIDSLNENHRYHAAVGDFYYDLKEHQKALSAYDKAIELVLSEKERNLLLKKKQQLS
jgi:RNA polymerase sigma factor (sigma-70 family)